MMKIGVTIGKFYPFHLGHDYLIREAKAKVDRLIVLVCDHPSQAISGTIRANWIRLIHPEVEVIEVIDDLPEAPEPWAERTLAVLGPRLPHIAFTSENYGEPWAQAMGIQHKAIDIPRHKFPISGTQLRADLSQHWQMLTPPAKAYFAKRICVLGVESSGTTTLAQALAAHYQTVWVPEYGRSYWEGKRYLSNQGQWDSYEFEQIARGQTRWEDDLATQSHKLVICDTDALATCVWHKRYLGYDSAIVETISDRRHYDLYILTNPDFGFVQDGTRDSEHLRMTMHQWFIDLLIAKDKNYLLVTGSHAQRMAQSIKAIDPILVFPPVGSATITNNK